MKHTNLILIAVAIIISCNPAKKMTTSNAKIKHHKTGSLMKDSFLTGMLNQYPQYFDDILKNKEKWNVQIIYTQIDRLAGNKPVFTDHYFNVDANRYFYPASTVKLPIAVLALEKLNDLDISGLNRNTTMITEAGNPYQTTVYNDATTQDGRPTIAQYIKKILLVSDNDGFNRLYEFLGQEYSNNSLHKMGYDSTQITHRLSLELNEEQNRLTNPIKFYSPDNKVLYKQPLVKSNLVYQPRTTLLGKGYMDGAKLVKEPFDFSKKNRLLLADLHSIVRSVLFPESLPKKKRFNLTKADYSFLHQYMSMKPGESRFPFYDNTHTDAYVKFLLFGANGAIPESLRMFNKVGDAYGFLTDAAYIVDFNNHVEFFLSATIYCNSDQVFNDDNYDYDTIGFPFMKNLGQVIYEYELKRTRKNKPDLSAFKFEYGN